MSQHETIIKTTKLWIEKIVIALNLCPFAAKPFNEGRIRYFVERSSKPDPIFEHIHAIFQELDENQTIETAFLILPHCTPHFIDYLNLLDDAEQKLKTWGYEGTYQLAGFHPCYQFSGTSKGDIENHTNRSPYVMIHILREASLEKALQSFPHPESIPEQNIDTLKKLGFDKLNQLLNDLSP